MNLELAANVKISVNPLALELWKPAMVISDFRLPEGENRYTLNKVVVQRISSNSKNATVSIEYYDARSNAVLTTDVHFQFKHTKKESIALILQDNKFSFNECKLNSLSFINLSKHDVTFYDANVRILGLAIKEWSVFDQRITFRINVLIYNKIRKTVFATRVFKVDSTALIRKLLTSDVSGSFFRINSYLEFEIERFTPLVKNYNLFFSKNDYTRFFAIVREIEIVSPKVLTTNLDIFRPRATAYFSSAVTINSKYFKNFVFKATYDARYLQSFIKTRLLELPFRSSVQGHPRTIAISLKNVYKDYKRTYLKTMLARNGLSDLLDSNIVIKVRHYNWKTNNARIELHFKMGASDHPPVVVRQMKFEKTLKHFATYRFKDNNFITLKQESRIDQHPLFHPQPGDFKLARTSDIKITAVKTANVIPIQSRWAKYKFILLANDPSSQITFSYVQDIYFSSSRLEHLLHNLSVSDLNIGYLGAKSDEYYYQQGLQFNQDWVPIFDKKIIRTIGFNARFRETDFVITKIQFQKQAIFKAKMPILLTVNSDILKTTRVIKSTIVILEQKLLQRFEQLKGSDIKLVHPRILASYPFPLLDISDFTTNKSFAITELTTRYNEHNSSVLCTFLVTLGAKERVIKKLFYFANDALHRIPKQARAQDLVSFKALGKDDIILDYDENNRTYFIDPEVSVKTKNPVFYARTSGWMLKSRWRKIVHLDIEVKYCSHKKSIHKTVKFRNRINASDYKAWKDANYAP